VENAEYRELGRMLAFERDNSALLDALELLRPHASAPLTQESLRILGAGFERRSARERQSGMPALQDRIQRVIDRLAVAGKRIADLPVESIGSRHLRRGVERTLGRCVAGFERARERPTPIELHEWRKDAKTAYHQTRLMRELIPGWAATTGPRLESLADALGHHHDLSLLEGKLQRHPDELDIDTQLHAILRLITTVSGELATSALDLGTELFEEGGAELTGLARRRIERG
jgi:hypothetical protein